MVYPANFFLIVIINELWVTKNLCVIFVTYILNNDSLRFLVCLYSSFCFVTRKKMFSYLSIKYIYALNLYNIYSIVKETFQTKIQTETRVTEQSPLVPCYDDIRILYISAKSPMRDKDKNL